jgi:AcrR family transcriptional regulator
MKEGKTVLAGDRAVGPALREDLVREARRLVEKGGTDALSLRAVARALGVSQTAPYLYFPDGVTELLAAVAEAGFEDLIRYMEASPRSPGDLRAVSVTIRYVRFGVEKPHLYRAMFSERLADPLESLAEDPATEDRGSATYHALRDVKQRAYQALVLPLEELEAEGALRRGSPWHFGLAVAALAHGLVGEFIDEGLGGRFSRDQAWSRVRAKMTHDVVRMLFDGLLEKGG